jgi:hypothetical protein
MDHYQSGPRCDRAHWSDQNYHFLIQNFLPLALYLSKASLYNLRQGNMANHDYLQRFQNLVDVAISYNGRLHDQAIIDIVTERLHPGVL